MKKFRIEVDFGGQGYTEYGGWLRLWKLIRKELKYNAHVKVHQRIPHE